MIFDGQLCFGDDDPLSDLGPRFMVHCPASKAAQLGPLTRTLGIGAVLTAAKTSTTRNAVITLRRANPAASILLDRHRYGGVHRRVARELPTQHWIDFQRALHIPWAMTDSGYIGAGDVLGLRGILRCGVEFGPNVITQLPLHIRWLTVDFDVLIEEVKAAGVPVALILESEADPLASVDAVCGLVRVLASVDTPVLKLRSDVSAVGALAFGAAATAIGSTSTLRHLYPMPESDDNDPGWGPKIAAVVPAVMAYRILDGIVKGVAANPDLPIWSCPCVCCYGRTLDWIADSNDPGRYAFEHSAAAISALAQRVMTPAVPADRQELWIELCGEAQANAISVINKPGGSRSWTPAPNLKAWRALARPRVP